jgi:hypothetical protein
MNSPPSREAVPVIVFKELSTNRELQTQILDVFTNCVEHSAQLPSLFLAAGFLTV